MRSVLDLVRRAQQRKKALGVLAVERRNPELHPTIRKSSGLQVPLKIEARMLCCRPPKESYDVKNPEFFDEILAWVRVRDEIARIAKHSHGSRQLSPDASGSFVVDTPQDLLGCKFVVTRSGVKVGTHTVRVRALDFRHQDARVLGALERLARTRDFGAIRDLVDDAMRGDADYLEKVSAALEDLGERQLQQRVLEQLVRVDESADRLLGLARFHREDLDKARALCERAVDIDPLVGLDALAEMTRERGDDEQAIKLYSRAIQIKDETRETKGLVANLTTLAALLRDKGDYDEAKTLYERALEIDEVALGRDHPDLTPRLNDLADVLQAQGHYEEAESHLARVVEILQDAVGSDDPKVATALDRLAGLLRALGEDDTAKRLYERAVRIDEKLQTSALARDLNHLALLLQDQVRKKIFVQPYDAGRVRRGQAPVRTSN